MDVIDAATLNSLHKNKLVDIILKQKKVEEDLRSKFNEEIAGLKNDVKSLQERAAVNSERSMNEVMKRAVDLERSLYAQEQYSRRECIELVGISSTVENKDLEKKVVEIFNKVGVAVTDRNFHAVHRLGSSGNVIAKLVNRKDAISILRNKAALRALSNEEKTELCVEKTLYVNESLCRAYRSLLGMCNALYKKKVITGFFTMNGKILIRTGGSKDNNGRVQGGELSAIGHVQDLKDKFGDAVMNKVFEEE